MSFTTETAKISGAIGKSGPAKIVPLKVKEKMELLFEDMLSPYHSSRRFNYV